MGDMMLRLNASTVSVLIREAAAQPDREVCGLVWGTETFQTVHPLPNVHPDPSRYYRTAPEDVRTAFNRMDDEGGKPLAWYHSHPGGKSDPSEEDMLGALNPGMHYLILYPETQELRALERMAPIGIITEWAMSAWECIETGVLVGVDWFSQ